MSRDVQPLSFRLCNVVMLFPVAVATVLELNLRLAFLFFLCRKDVFGFSKLGSFLLFFF